MTLPCFKKGMSHKTAANPLVWLLIHNRETLQNSWLTKADDYSRVFSSNRCLIRKQNLQLERVLFQQCIKSLFQLLSHSETAEVHAVEFLYMTIVLPLPPWSTSLNNSTSLLCHSLRRPQTELKKQQETNGCMAFGRKIRWNSALPIHPLHFLNHISNTK